MRIHPSETSWIEESLSNVEDELGYKIIKNQLLLSEQSVKRFRFFDGFHSRASIENRKKDVERHHDIHIELLQSQRELVNAPVQQEDLFQTQVLDKSSVSHNELKRNALKYIDEKIQLHQNSFLKGVELYDFVEEYHDNLNIEGQNVSVDQLSFNTRALEEKKDQLVSSFTTALLQIDDFPADGDRQLLLGQRYISERLNHRLREIYQEIDI